MAKITNAAAFTRVADGDKLKIGNVAPKLGDLGSWETLWDDMVARIGPGGDVREQIDLWAGLGGNCLRLILPITSVLDGSRTAAATYALLETVLDYAESVGIHYAYVCLGGGYQWLDGYTLGEVTDACEALASACAADTRIVAFDAQNEGPAAAVLSTPSDCAALVAAVQSAIAGAVPVSMSVVGLTTTHFAALTGTADFYDLHFLNSMGTTPPRLSDLNTFWDYRDGGSVVPVIVGENGHSVYNDAAAPLTNRQEAMENVADLLAAPMVVGCGLWCVKSAVTVPGAGGPEDLPGQTWGAFDADGDPYTGDSDITAQVGDWPRREGGAPFRLRASANWTVSEQTFTNPNLNATVTTPLSLGRSARIVVEFAAKVACDGSAANPYYFVLTNEGVPIAMSGGPGGYAAMTIPAADANAGNVVTGTIASDAVPASLVKRLHVGGLKTFGNPDGTVVAADTVFTVRLYPDANPAVESAEVAADGESTLLRLSQKVESAGVAADWALARTTGGAVTITAAALEEDGHALRLSHAGTPVYQSQSGVTVDYAGTAVEDLAGQAMAAFADAAVTNGSALEDAGGPVNFLRPRFLASPFLSPAFVG